MADSLRLGEGGAGLDPRQQIDKARAIVEALEGADEMRSLTLLGELDSLAQDMTFDRVRALREDWQPPVSWEAIGTAIGVSRQTAWDRWSASLMGPKEMPHERQAHQPTQRSEGPEWWKLNVDKANVEACMAHRVFGTTRAFQWQPGDVLLLQEKLDSRPDPERRIRAALIYESIRPAKPGESQALWPGSRSFDRVVIASEALPTNPFSLEHLGLAGNYSRPGQMSPQRILPEDLPAVRDASGLDR